MSVSLEELVKSDKDRDLDRKYKNVRNALKLSLSKHISEYGGGFLERTVDNFVGLESGDKKNPEMKTGNKSFLDDLTDIGKLMDDAFNKMGDAEEGALAHRLASVSAIYMDRIAHACYESKLNRFPLYKEKFAMDISDEKEAKSVVPKQVFHSIKVFLDKYYFLFRQASVNARARIIYAKLGDFRDRLLNFEWSIHNYTSKLDGEYAKEIAPFFKDTKMALLRLRKLFEAIESSEFGKLAKTLREEAVKSGIRLYLKYNPVVTIFASTAYKGSAVPLQSIMEKYDRFMEPIRTAVADYDRTKRAMQQRSFLSDTPKMFWDISGQIVAFRDGMYSVIEDFSKGISQADEDFKYFTHTVQTVLIPYMNQTKGEVNDSFVVSVGNLDTFFWKVMVKTIEYGQENGETMEEIIGTAVRIKKSDLEERTEAEKASKEPVRDS